MSKTMSKTLTMPELTAQELVARVQQRLAPYQPSGAVMEVLPKPVHQEGRWWYVVVPPITLLTNASDYHTRVEKAERDLKRMDGLTVGILPVVPDWMDALK